MPISKGEKFKHKDIYIDYDFEQVMFKWDHLERNIYIKFYGESEGGGLVPHDNRLFNDALLYGDEITLDDYLKGKKTING